MAGKRDNEFAGTAPSDGSEPVNPATLVGSGGGTGDSGGDDFDPAIHISRDKRNGDGSYKRKRGRKNGNPQAGPLNLSGIESVLLSMHTMLAAATQSPELALDSTEAKMMTEAIAEVAKHYPMTIDPKALAWGNLVMAAAMIYGPRVYMIRERKRKEKPEKKAETNVMQFVAPIQ